MAGAAAITSSAIASICFLCSKDNSFSIGSSNEVAKIASLNPFLLTTSGIYCCLVIAGALISACLSLYGDGSNSIV